MKKLCSVMVVFSLIWLVVGGSHVLAADKAVAATSKPTTKILIAGARVGNSWYIFSQALANFINKGSKWLRADVAATPGLTANFEMLRDKPQQYIGVGNLGSFLHYRLPGEFSKKRGLYDKARFIATANSQTVLWVTFKKNTKGHQDFVGKRVNTHRHGAAIADDLAAILQAWGVLDKVKISRTAWGEGADLLSDGLVDIMALPVDHVYPSEFKKSALIAKLEAKSPIYYIGMEDPQMLDKLRDKGHATVPIKVPAGALDPKTQPTSLWAFGDPVFFMADESMNEDVVSEVTRILCESAGKWASWHAQGAHMTMDFIPAMPLKDFSLVHPAALKYYKQHGIKVVDIAERLR
jgi:TRAP transporter TAXI family solute receptor